MPVVLLGLLTLTGVFVSLTGFLLVAERFLVNYGDCTVNINNGANMLTVKGGGTLLAALYEKKVFIPSACGGKCSCGFCKVTVISGGGPNLPTEAPYVTRAELKRGVRLACQVKVKQDIEIRIPEELLSVKEFQAEVLASRTLTSDTKELSFTLVDPPEITHRPGQYVQIVAPSPEGNVFRAYSISSPVFENKKVQLLVRLVPGGIASTYLHGLKSGDRVMFTGPFGEFRLSEDPAVEVICVGGGCGMAPMANIVQTLYSRWPDRRCYLFFGCRTKQDVFYLDTFRELAKRHPSFEVVYALSNPLGADERWDGDTGFIHLSVDKRLKPGPPPRRQAFLCGPPPMIEAVTDVLKAKGLGDEDIFYDKF